MANPRFKEKERVKLPTTPDCDLVFSNGKKVMEIPCATGILIQAAMNSPYYDPDDLKSQVEQIMRQFKQPLKFDEMVMVAFALHKPLKWVEEMLRIQGAIRAKIYYGRKMNQRGNTPIDYDPVGIRFISGSNMAGASEANVDTDATDKVADYLKS